MLHHVKGISARRVKTGSYSDAHSRSRGNGRSAPCSHLARHPSRPTPIYRETKTQAAHDVYYETLSQRRTRRAGQIGRIRSSQPHPNLTSPKAGTVRVGDTTLDDDAYVCASVCKQMHSEERELTSHPRINIYYERCRTDAPPSHSVDLALLAPSKFQYGPGEINSEKMCTELSYLQSTKGISISLSLSLSPSLHHSAQWPVTC